ASVEYGLMPTASYAVVPMLAPEPGKPAAHQLSAAALLIQDALLESVHSHRPLRIMLMLAPPVSRRPVHRVAVAVTPPHRPASTQRASASLWIEAPVTG